MTATYYALKTPMGSYELRQVHLKKFFEPDKGREHRDDLCAVSGSLADLKSMAERHIRGEIDWSGVEP